MFRSDDVLVTRDGAPAGFYVPWDTPDVAVEVRRATAKRCRRVAGSARAERPERPTGRFDRFGAPAG